MPDGHEYSLYDAKDVLKSRYETSVVSEAITADLRLLSGPNGLFGGCAAEFVF